MARIQDRQKVLLLRQQGKTYSEIRQELGIAKSTLSDWLRNFPLTTEQMELLEKQKKYKKQIAIEKTRIVKQQKREVRLKEFYVVEKEKWKELSQRELELAGLFLYWGEGNKGLRSAVSLNNTDPKVVKFALYWIVKGLNIPKAKIKVGIHL